MTPKSARIVELRLSEIYGMLCLLSLGLLAAWASFLVEAARTCITNLWRPSTEISKKAGLFAKLQPGRARKRINAT